MSKQDSEPLLESATPPQRGVKYEEVVTLHAEAKAQESRVAARWALGLAVGNGAGLVALSSQIISNIDKPVAYLLFPSAWLFAIGLCIIGVAPGLGNWRSGLEVSDLGKVRHDVWAGRSAEWKAAKPKTVRNLYILEVAAEALSGVLFAAGLIYPLAVLAHRYVGTGSFS